MCYEDNVLIKLKRQYSKDEYVQHLLKEIKEKDVLIGQYQALDGENHFLNKKIDNQKKAISSLLKKCEDLQKEIKKTPIYLSLKQQLSKALKENRELRKIRNELIIKLNKKQ